MRRIVLLAAVAVLASGCNMFTVGANDAGQLGLGTTVRALTPQALSSDIPWSQVAPGEEHTCGIKIDGTAWCWGDNTFGRLGDGTTTDRLTPTRVGTEANWSIISAGYGHTCGTKTDGTAWCWGWNSLGQVGDGTPADQRLTPTQVGVDADWSTIATGYGHTCGTKADGTAWCWGDNFYGQVGDGTTTQQLTPTQVGTNSDWASITTGSFHSCATATNNTAWCWGWNAFGSLGDGTTTDRLTPTEVGGIANWASISAGYGHTCGAAANNTVWCWGANDDGQLGDDTTIDRLAPIQVGNGTDWSSVQAGQQHSCATAADDTTWCWGNNANGQLGTGAVSLEELSPVVAIVPGKLASVAANAGHSCGVTAFGSLFCWGDNLYGQIGDGTTADRPQGHRHDTPNQWAEISAGASHSCAVNELTETVWCWGDNTFGQLGFGDTTDRQSPAPIPNPPGVSGWTQVDAGRAHTCAVAIETTMWCWGNNADGELGQGTQDAGSTSPVRVGTNTNWVDIEAGNAHSCALIDNGNLWCWGSNADGEVGNGSTATRTTPTKIGAPGFKFSDIDAEQSHTCGVELDGTIWCWGANTGGQTLPGSTTNQTSPIQVGSDSDWAEITTGLNHSCAIKTNATLWCWGDALAAGTAGAGNQPITQIGGMADWLTVDGGTEHTCAIRSSGTLWCWGNNSNGQLGTGNTTNQPSPTQIGTNTGHDQVSAGGTHTLSNTSTPG